MDERSEHSTGKEDCRASRKVNGLFFPSIARYKVQDQREQGEIIRSLP